jgi:hypothetical protein
MYYHVNCICPEIRERGVPYKREEVEAAYKALSAAERAALGQELKQLQLGAAANPEPYLREICHQVSLKVQVLLKI